MVRKLALAVSLALGGISFSAHGLGLGDINANSVLNQNFNAEITLLSATEGELDSLKVRLASPEAFSKAGVERPFYLSLLRFAPRKGADGNLHVKVTSDFPIREPFLNFLIELNWPNGRLVREYTVLLDPPTTVRRAPPPIVAPQRQVQPAAPATRPAPTKRPSVSPRPAAPRVAPAVAGAMPGEYGPVRSGETAWRIAERVRPQGASVVQTMMALHRANPRAFIRNNINKLRRGQILRVPSRDKILEMSVTEARVAFRESQRDSVVASPPSAPVAKRPAPADRIEPITRQAERVPVTEARPASVPEVERGRLKIATALPKEQGRAGAEGDATKIPDAASDAIQQQLLIAQENAETSRQEAVNLRDRVDDLELQLRDLQRLLTIRDDQFAQIQADVASEDSTVAEGVGIDVAEGTAEALVTDGVTEELAEELEQSLVAAQQAADAAMDAAKGGVDTPKPADFKILDEEEPGVVSLDSTVESAVVADAAPIDRAPTPGPTAELAPETEVVETPTSMTEAEVPKPFGRVWLEQNWPFVAGGVGGLAALGILLGLLLGRRNRDEEDTGIVELTDTRDAEGSGAEADVEAEMDAAIAAVAKEYGDEGESSSEPAVTPDDEMPQAAEGRAPGSDVDPLSEADVYIAYGRYQQAEELLKAATRRDPQRLDLKLKLLEVYNATRNRGAYVALAGQMAEAGEDRIDVTAWDRVQELGRELDPENSLFEAPTGRASGLAAVSALAAGVAAASSVDDDDLSLDDLEISELASDLDAETDIDDEMGASELDMALDLDDLDADGASAQNPQVAESIDELESLELEFPDLNATEDNDEVAEPEAEDDFERRKEDVHPSLDLDGSLEASQQVDEESILNIDTDLDADELQAQLDELSDLSMLDTEMADPGATDQTFDQPLDLEAALANLGGDSELSTEALESYTESEDVNEEDVETKLDLARAYIEMGDGEGARSLLAEVQQEGSDEQKVAAVKLLAEVETEV